MAKPAEEWVMRIEMMRVPHRHHWMPVLQGQAEGKEAVAT